MTVLFTASPDEVFVHGQFWRQYRLRCGMVRTLTGNSGRGAPSPCLLRPVAMPTRLQPSEWLVGDFILAKINGFLRVVLTGSRPRVRSVKRWLRANPL
eukprot:scaffold4957_cov152-Amphora_coffeaeformis.AAC.4